MTLNPILKVLSSIKTHRVHALLMGGQACVFYGAAEFSRDTDLAIHFRCQHVEALGMRVDVMTKMRGVDPFPKLWTRRTTVAIDGSSLDLMSLPDLVQAKKTQRDKDWPMVRRLIEVNYFENRENPTREQVRFWFLELRTPDLLIELAAEQGRIPAQLRRKRPLLELATAPAKSLLTDALIEEEQREREADRQYWAPLKKELERLRHARASLTRR